MEPKLFQEKIEHLAELRKDEHGVITVKNLKVASAGCPYDDEPRNCRIDSRLHQATAGYPKHWRHKCWTCGAHINMKTKEKQHFPPHSAYALRQFYNSGGDSD